MTISPASYRFDVTSPGKFEGETGATCYFYECIMHGDGELLHSDEHGGTSVTGFTATNCEAAQLGELGGFQAGDAIAIVEDSNGFVSLLAYATEAARNWDIKRTFG